MWFFLTCWNFVNQLSRNNLPMNKLSLVIKDLHAEKDGKEILRGLSLEIPMNRVTAIMGPNGSGKSTLSHVLMGSPNYTVTKGSITWRGKNLLLLEPHQRAQLGLFLSFQSPVEVPGVNVYEFLLTAYQSVAGKKANQDEFTARVADAKKQLKISDTLLERSLNEGFSGGEKKRLEMFQLLVIRPKIAILDEVDSGLDIDALKLIARTLKILVSDQCGLLVITHYQRLLDFLAPDAVHILMDGKFVESGSSELVKKLEEEGYDWLIQKH